MKRIFLAFMVFIVFFNVAYAFNFTVDDAITLRGGDAKSLDINVTSEDDSFIVSLVGQKPWMTISPRIQAVGGFGSTKLYLSPPYETAGGIYKVTIGLESTKTSVFKSKDVYITIESSDIKVGKIIISNAEPSGLATAEIYINNYGREKNISFELIVSQNGKDVAVTGTRKLNSGLETFSRNFYLPECASDEYTAKLKLYDGNKTLDYAEVKFTVAEKSIIKMSSSEERLIVRNKKEFALKNTGNKAGATEIRERILGSVFFSGDEPTKIESGDYVWVVDLESCEEKIIRYQVDYSPIIAILFIIVAIWYVWYKFRIIRIRKMILQKKMIEEGEEFTVGVEVKSYVSMKDIEIRDFVPSVFKVIDTAGIKPVKTKSESGTELIWKIHALKRGEERILDYKIIPMFGVHGRIKLPQASIKFNYLTRKVEKKSNPAVMGVETKKEKEKRDFFDVFNLDRLFGK